MLFVKFRLYPTPAQEVLLLEHCRHARKMWNVGLEQRNMYRPAFGPTPNYNEQSAQLTEARAEFDWLKAGSQTVQQQALLDLKKAFDNWWAGTHGRPTWRSRGVHESFRIVGKQAKRWERLSRNRARVKVPKIGWVDWRWSRHPGTPDSYRIRQDRAGKWWISFAVIPPEIDGPNDGSVVGVDRGIAVSAALSDGPMLHWPGLTDNEQARLLRLQRKLARQQKDSKRHEKTKLQISRLRHRGINRRDDAIEKATTDLAQRFDIIRVEDLKVKNMVRSAKGTVEEPGTNVAAKRGLNREIQKQAWGRFARRLEDKIGDRLQKVPAAFTSQRCSVCGEVDRKNRESQAIFRCTTCDYADNADVNAARNIAAGCAVTSRGGPPVREPTKREPLAL